MKILILGGSGFLSGTLARRAITEGHEVWAVTRGQKPLPEGVRGIEADRNERDNLANQIETLGGDWDLVVDCIGFEPVHAKQDIETFRNRASHLVFVSTDFVYDPAQRTFPQTEENRHFANVGYGGKKRQCELEFESANCGDMKWTILRPCHIYGPGSLLGCLPEHGRDAKLIEKMQKGEPLRLVGGGHFLQQPIFADDLAKVILHCPKAKNSGSEIFQCAGPDIVESKRVYEIIAEILGVELAIEEVAVDEYSAAHPEAAPFLCHRIYDLGKLRGCVLPAPATRLVEGLRAHVSAILQRRIQS